MAAALKDVYEFHEFWNNVEDCSQLAKKLSHFPLASSFAEDFNRKLFLHVELVYVRIKG